MPYGTGTRVGIRCTIDDRRVCVCARARAYAFVPIHTLLTHLYDTQVYVYVHGYVCMKVYNYTRYAQPRPGHSSLESLLDALAAFCPPDPAAVEVPIRRSSAKQVLAKCKD